MTPARPGLWQGRRLALWRAGLVTLCAAAGLVVCSGCGPAPSAGTPGHEWLRDYDAVRQFALEHPPAAAPALAPAQAGEGTPPAPPPRAEGSPGRDAMLETVLRSAVEKGPMARAAYHRWAAATHRRAQAVALPDPKFEATYFAIRKDDKYMLSLSQEVPFPGKLLLAGQIADKEERIAYLRYLAAARNALAETKDAYFELYYIDRAMQVTEEIKTLYDRYAALAVGGTEVAKPKLPETFRAESQRAQLGYDLVLLREMRRSEAERLRAAAGLPPEMEIGPPGEVAQPPDELVRLEELQGVTAARNQELAAAGVEVEKAEIETRLAHQGPIPDFMVGVSRVGKTMTTSRDQPLGLMAGFSIPLWAQKYKARNREAEELEEAMRQEEQAAQRQVRSDLARAYFSLTNSSRLVRLYHQVLIPQARQALQSSEELYRKGQASMSGVLETTATVHNFELARLRATADYYQNVARIERVIGTALELRPAAPAPGAAPAPALPQAKEAKP